MAQFSQTGIPVSPVTVDPLSVSQGLFSVTAGVTADRAQPFVYFVARSGDH